MAGQHRRNRLGEGFGMPVPVAVGALLDLNLGVDLSPVGRLFPFDLTATDEGCPGLSFSAVGDIEVFFEGAHVVPTLKVQFDGHVSPPRFPVVSR